MSKRLRYGLLIGVCLLGASGGMLVSYRVMPQEFQRTMRPFTAQIIEKHFMPDGSLAPLPGGIEYITVARKSDGSHVRFVPIQGPDGSYTLPRDIFDVSGKEIVVLPDTKSVSTFYVAAEHVAHHVAHFESCPPAAEDPNAAQSTQLGYRVVEITSQGQTRLGVEEDTQWVAPALNCFALSDTNISRSGARNETEVIAIFEGEPPEAWFTAPKGYTERGPSQVAAAYAKRFPGHKFISDQTATTGDRTYSLHRSPSQ